VIRGLAVVTVAFRLSQIIYHGKGYVETISPSEPQGELDLVVGHFSFALVLRPVM
jgi:hypothetical protein